MQLREDRELLVEETARIKAQKRESQGVLETLSIPCANGVGGGQDMLIRPERRVLSTPHEGGGLPAGGVWYD